MNTSSLASLMDNHKEGYSLQQPFYLDPDIFEADLKKVISPLWHLVDHQSRIPNPGDYFLSDLAGESIIIIRGRDDIIRAFYNVCRHRGSIICKEREGNTKMLRCPYHAWTYDLDGSLKVARLMHDEFDKSEYSLHPCHVQISHGLIFICINQGDAPDFEELVNPLNKFLAIHGFDKAKIAHRGDYPTDANWKLVLENFYECYHCLPSHPEYCMVHPKDFILAYGGGTGSGPIGAEEDYAPQLEAFNAKAEAMGHPTGNINETEMSLHYSGAGRTGIGEGFISETEDGTPAAPLMGNFTDWDGGYTSVTFSPFSSIISSNDFATIFRFIPRDATYTDVELIWLVREDAVEGKDYDLEKMIWMWDVTTIADKRIIEDNHAGVSSRVYQPGPYSQHEIATDYLIKWYLNRLKS